MEVWCANCMTEQLRTSRSTPSQGYIESIKGHFKSQLHGSLLISSTAYEDEIDTYPCLWIAFRPPQLPVFPLLLPSSHSFLFEGM